jgi:hypothetical protein
MGFFPYLEGEEEVRAGPTESGSWEDLPPRSRLEASIAERRGRVYQVESKTRPSCGAMAMPQE